MPLTRALAAWLVILTLAIANGALREAVLIPMLGARAGLVSSGIALSLAVLLVAFALARLTPGLTVRQGARIGALWLVLTLAFEFTFGRLVAHKAWSELFAAYTFEGGNLWPVVLLVTLLSPIIAVRTGGTILRQPDITPHSRSTPTSS